MEKKSERLKEGWVDFTRVYCKEGFIDCFFGDMADNPNRDKRSNIMLNAFDMWYRLGGTTEWVHKDDFRRNFQGIVYNSGEVFTAQEIWDYGKTDVE